MTIPKLHFVFPALLFVFCSGYHRDVDATQGTCETFPSLNMTSDEIDSLTQEHFVAILTDPCHFERHIKPPTPDTLPVTLQVIIEHMEAVDKVAFNLYMVVQYEYTDSRLAYRDFSPTRQKIIGEEKLKQKIWIPHLVIKNQKGADISGMDEKDVFLSINPDGGILYSYRTTVTFYCYMNLMKFPFDSQECQVSWDSWRYNMSNLVLNWDEEFAIKKAENLRLTEFVIVSLTNATGIVPGSFTKGHLTGLFTELRIDFKLRRQTGYYIMGYFLPSVLLVCTAWVTFWLQADAGPPRATLGASTVIAFITLNLGLSNGIPKVSYVKASDIWFLVCSVFIFGSLSEFAFVNVIWRRRKTVELKKQTPKYILKGALTPSVARSDIKKTQSMRSLYTPKSWGGSFDDRLPETYLTVHGISSISDGGTGNGFTSSGELLSNSSISVSVPEIAEQTTTTGESPNSGGFHTMSPQEVAIWIDRKARIVFPLAFLLFNIFYWTFVFLV